MAWSIVLVVAYFAATALIGFIYRKHGPERSEYVIGGKRAGTFLLLATLAATNFSAFTVFGLSGAGYRIGWAYYPVMGFGTGLMALSFIIVGIPLRRLAKARGYLSPADFIRDRYGSPVLARAFSVALALVTLPYLATQAVAAGRMLEIVTGMPYALSSLLVVGLTSAYTFRGGFRAVAATDAFQLVVLLGGAGIAFGVVIGRAGGLSAVSLRLSEISPALLSRQGGGPGLDLAGLCGMWLLWLLADPLFPQLFQRFYAARDDRVLVRTAALYPLVTGCLFFLTVGIGVVGAALLPGLEGKRTEQVFTLLAADSGRPLLGAVFVLAALAALMSTMDSQLLTLSSMATQDFLPARYRKPAADKAFIAALAAAAWLISLVPPTLILDVLTGTAFPAYAALAPAVYAGLYWRKAEAGPVGAALLLGLGLVAAESLGYLDTGRIPAVFVNLGAQVLLLAASSFLPHSSIKAAGTVRPGFRSSPLGLALVAAVALLATDFWSYGRPAVLVLGAPDWVWRSMLCCLALSLVYARWPARPGPGRKKSALPRIP